MSHVHMQHLKKCRFFHKACINFKSQSDFLLDCSNKSCFTDGCDILYRIAARCNPRLWSTVICSRIIAGLSLDNQFLVAYYLAINGNPLMQLWLFLIGSLINFCLPLILDSVFLFLKYPPPHPTVSLSKIEDLLVLNTALCVCLHTEAKQRSGGSEDWKDVVLLKSTVSICLSVRCLAWLSSTER